MKCLPPPEPSSLLLQPGLLRKLPVACPRLHPSFLPSLVLRAARPHSPPRARAPREGSAWKERFKTVFLTHARARARTHAHARQFWPNCIPRQGFSLIPDTPLFYRNNAHSYIFSLLEFIS